MSNFSAYTDWVIPEGVVTQVADESGRVIWSRPHARYVSLVYKHSNNTSLPDDSDTGNIDCYALYVGDETSPKPKFGNFADSQPITYRVPYGTQVRVVVSCFNPSELVYDDVDCTIYLNGSLLKSGYRGTEYSFTLTKDTVIDFTFNMSGGFTTFDRKEWEDCYITEQPSVVDSIMYLDEGALDSATLG